MLWEFSCLAFLRHPVAIQMKSPGGWTLVGKQSYISKVLKNYDYAMEQKKGFHVQYSRCFDPQKYSLSHIYVINVLVQILKSTQSPLLYLFCHKNMKKHTPKQLELGMAWGIPRPSILEVPDLFSLLDSPRNRFYHSSGPRGPRQNSSRTSKIGL